MIGLIPVCPGCVITCDGPGRFVNATGDDERRKFEEGEEVDDWLGGCKAAKAAKKL